MEHLEIAICNECENPLDGCSCGCGKCPDCCTGECDEEDWLEDESADTEDEHISKYQEMINSGLAWQLEGAVGREAMRLLDAGLCILGEQGYKDFWGNYVPSRHEVKPGTKGSVEYCQNNLERD